jgi:hypothetical protein
MLKDGYWVWVAVDEVIEVKGWDKVGLTLFDNQLVEGGSVWQCCDVCVVCCASFGTFDCCVVQTGLYCSIYNTV